MLLVYTGLVILIYMQFAAGENYKKNRNICIIIGAFLFLISAMKDIDPQTDLIGYAQIYKRLRVVWSYRDVYEQWVGGRLKDVLFYLVAEFFTRLGFSDQAWMAMISLFFGVAAAWFIYCNSAKPVLSLLLLMTLEYFRFTLTGLRQTTAMAVILMFSYQFILDRKPIKFILSVLVASLLHSSALLFLPAYWIASWKMGWRQLALVGGVGIVYWLFPNVFRWLLGKIAWTDSIASYVDRTVALSWAGFIIQACILAFCFMFRNETNLTPYYKWRRIDALINCMVVGLCLQMLATMIAEAFRMAYYYNLCVIAVVPNLVVENRKKANHAMMYLLLAACLLVYMLRSRAYFDLKFFWQG